MDCTTNGRPLQGAVPIDICSRDAWLARRLLRGLHEPSDIEVASPGFRPVAERIATHPPEGSGREVILNEWLEPQSDAFTDAFDAAMGKADPNGPPPADEPETTPTEGEVKGDTPPPADESEPESGLDSATLEQVEPLESFEGESPGIQPYDANVMRRILATSMFAESEIAKMTPPWKGLAEQLASLPIEERSGVYSEFVAKLANADEVARLIADQNPTAHTSLLIEAGEEPRESKTPDVLVRRASDIEPLTVEWLWRARLPLGMLSMFAGDPKLGKSFVTVALAAAVSRGAPFPHGDAPNGPGSVILMSAEDDPARTIVPRLKSAGANLDKVHIFEAVKTTDGGDRLPSLAADIDRLGGIVERIKDCRLVVIDPITSYLGGVDDHRNAELRGVLSPLKAMAERLNVAVVLITHLNKGQGTNGKHRVTGSIAYVGACRANFLFCRDHENPARVLMLDNGCNLAGEVPTLAYRIDDLGDGPTVVWEDDPVPITADEALQAQTDGHREQDHEEARECDRWLRGTLAAGPMKAKELYGFAANAGFSKDQLKRAKQRVGVVSDRNGFGDGSAWFWSLRNESDAAVEDDERDDETPY